MSNDRWTPRYEHDDAEPAAEHAVPHQQTEQSTQSFNDAPDQSFNDAPDWSGGTGESPTAKDWQEGRVDPAPWQQGMTAKELAASSPDEESVEPASDELETIEDEPTHLPAVPDEEAPAGPSSGLLYGLGMLAVVLTLAPSILGLVEIIMTSTPWWGTVLGLLPPAGILLAAHVLLRILLSIRDKRR